MYLLFETKTVGMTRFEPTTSKSRTQRATYCATSRFFSHPKLQKKRFENNSKSEKINQFSDRNRHKPLQIKYLIQLLCHIG